MIIMETKKQFERFFLRSMYLIRANIFIVSDQIEMIPQ
jgi:hypothetical protein